MKVTRISEIKKDFRFWSNITIFLLFLALILSEITVFQKDFISPFYGENLMTGMGIIITAISWATIFSSIKNKISNMYWREIAGGSILIIGLILVPHTVVFVIGGIIIIFYGTLLYMKIVNKGE